MEEQQISEEPKKGSSSKMIIMAVVVVVVILVGVIGYQALSKKSVLNEEATEKTEEKTAAPTDTIAPSSTDGAKMTAASYKNGTYTETGNYISPGGQEQIQVTVTLTDGKIADSSVVTFGLTPTSKLKQKDFSENYKEFVVGKNIDEVMLTKVSGSSLTPKGFDDALEKIKAKAKA